MINKFLPGIKNLHGIIGVCNQSRYIGRPHILKLLEFSEKNRVKFNFSEYIIDYLSRNLDYINLRAINTFVKVALYSKYNLGDLLCDKLLIKLNNTCLNDRILSLDTLYYLLLLNHNSSLSSAKCVDILNNFRLSSYNEEQLKVLHIFYAIQFNHPNIQTGYTPQIENYFNYLKLLSPKIRLGCGLNEESEEIVQVKETMDDLNVEYLSSITGHIYSPIVLKGTNMAIDIGSERFVTLFTISSFRYKYYESEEYTPMATLKEKMMREMGWRMRFIPIEEWRCNRSDEQKKMYLSKFISKFYVDTQFIKNPPWVAFQ